MNNNNLRKRLKNHIVPKSYIAQWHRKNEEFFSLYLIKENLIKEANKCWHGFWRKGFNILEGDIFSDDEYNFPEYFTRPIDGKGISIIRSIDTINKERLDNISLQQLSLYVALQYFRTPKFRDELNSIKELVIQEFPEINRENIANINEFAANKQMEFILRIEKFAKEIFGFRWVFLLTPQETSFMTSDSPCFAIDDNESSTDKGLLSQNANIIFPLRPDICLFINNNRNQGQFFFKLDKQNVRDINKIIIGNAYSAVVASDKKHLIYLTNNFDYQNHKPSREATVQKIGEYIKFGLS